MYGLPPQLEHVIDEQLCVFWPRDDFSAWATGAGFMATQLGHSEVRGMLRWLMDVRAYTAEEGDWNELR